MDKQSMLKILPAGEPSIGPPWFSPQRIGNFLQPIEVAAVQRAFAHWHGQSRGDEAAGDVEWELRVWAKGP